MPRKRTERHFNSKVFADTKYSDSEFSISFDDIIDYSVESFHSIQKNWQKYDDRNEEIEDLIKLIEDLKNTEYDDPDEQEKLDEVIQCLEDKFQKLQDEKFDLSVATKSTQGIAWQVFFGNLNVWKKYFNKLKPKRMRWPQKLKSKTLTKLNRYGAKTASFAYLATSGYELYSAYQDDSKFQKQNEEKIQELRHLIEDLQNTEFDDEEDTKNAQELIADFENYLSKLSKRPKHRQFFTACARISGAAIVELAAFSILGPVGLTTGLIVGTVSLVTGSTLASKAMDYFYEKNDPVNDGNGDSLNDNHQ